MNGCMDGRMDEWTDGWMDGRMHQSTNTLQGVLYTDVQPLNPLSMRGM